MVEVGELQSNLLRVCISRIHTIVLIAVLLDPVRYLQFGSSALRLDIVVLFNIDLSGEKIESRLLLRFFRLIGPEVFDLAFLCALTEALHASLLVLLNLCQCIKLFLLLGHHFACSFLETLEQLRIVLLRLVLVVRKFEFHARCIVCILFDSLIGLLLDLKLNK